ncbi:phage scaffold protein [Streptococcus suis]|uniref:phage scaffold protein n=1 Tax=Streptococcus suis TaxID=1307 RepID=UPI001ABE779D|nr:phage scaffold protein [Streptococcus suis]MDW8651071.1 phage scaffold protein [Streptococcus suis]HEL2737699.1 phage scaffold protein [Streptococcus suis]HEM2744593.1 phage scaffold protein [Streptococcus suis]
MSTFTPITTQEEFDSAIRARISREREKFADYDSLKERVAHLESENATLKESVEVGKQSKADFDKKVAELQSQIAGFESEKLRNRIALEHGLPLEMAGRLQGDDEASLVADAQSLAGFIKATEPVAPLKNEEPIVDGKHAGIKQMLQNLKGE